MRIKYENLKLKQSQIANRLSYSTSTLQRYRKDLNMFSSYRVQPNNTNKRAKRAPNTNFDNNSHPDFDFKRPRLTPNDLKTTQTKTKSKKKNKNVLIVGSIRESIEIMDDDLDEILHNNII